LQESQALENPITELAKRLGIALSEEVSASFVDEANDKELVELSSRLAGQSLPASDQVASIQVLTQLCLTVIVTHLYLLLREFWDFCVMSRYFVIIGKVLQQAHYNYRN
jgi:hypothetical protein